MIEAERADAPAEAPSRRWGWARLVLLLLACVLVPFAVMGGWMDQRIVPLLSPGRLHPLVLAGVLCALLASDILLPIPSSVVSTACGYLLGFWTGALVSWVGMTLGSLLGYELGRSAGDFAARRLVSDTQRAEMQQLALRWGHWAIAVARPIPVLAETSVVFAGISRLPRGRVAVICLLSNLGVSIVYAAVGAFSASWNAFFLAVAAAFGIPAVALLVSRRTRARVVPHVDA
jgi:uncharacterized membrane protein YdjX (TVP38/TMEM64 family)